MSASDTAPSTYDHHLKGGGEMGELIRNYNWAESVLGTPDNWPSALLTTVGIILNARFPMFLFWGDDLIQFYNDAYRPSLGNNGKHPTALGQRGEDCWPEIWPEIKPIINQVMSGGEATFFEDRLLPIFRNNKLEDVYWTFGYSQVSDGSGKPAGVLVICNETTQKVTSAQMINETQNRFRSMIAQSPVAMLVTRGDDMIFEDVNPAMLTLIGRDETVIGKPWYDAMPELRGQPIIDRLYHTYHTGQPWEGADQPIKIYRNNRLEIGYFNISYKPLTIDQKVVGVLQVAVEVTESVEAFNSLQQAKQELELAIEAADLATWDLNPGNNYFMGNSRLKAWFGLPMDEEIDLNNAISRIIEADRQNVIESIQNALKPGSDGNYNVIYTIVNPDNKVRRTVKASGKAVFNDEGIAYRFSGILQDVTDDYQIQQRKDEFISVASHELKTPMTSLNASMQILQRLVKTDPASDKIPVFVGKASNNLNKLLRLLDDLLNVTKIQQGQLALNKTMFNLGELVRDCTEHVQLDGDHHFNISGDHELMIYADYRRIDQVMINLINNAVKYAPQSKQIDITITHDEEKARVSVRDYGIGINPEKLPHLFDRYYRVDALGHQFSGLGLGLYISSEIITRHGGDIGVESNKGEGSEFWFTIPLNAD